MFQGCIFSETYDPKFYTPRTYLLQGSIFSVPYVLRIFTLRDFCPMALYSQDPLVTIIYYTQAKVLLFLRYIFMHCKAIYSKNPRFKALYPHVMRFCFKKLTFICHMHLTFTVKLFFCTSHFVAQSAESPMIPLVPKESRGLCTLLSLWCWCLNLWPSAQ